MNAPSPVCPVPDDAAFFNLSGPFMSPSDMPAFIGWPIPGCIPMPGCVPGCIPIPGIMPMPGCIPMPMPSIMPIPGIIPMPAIAIWPMPGWVPIMPFAIAAAFRASSACWSESAAPC